MPNLDLSGITPHRTVTVTWDKTQNVLQEAATIWRRTSGNSIFPSSETNIEELASKVRVLAPENDLTIAHESDTANKPYIIRLEDWHFAPCLKEVPRQRILSELLGVDPGPDVSTTGDWWITKRIGGGDTWDQKLEDVEPGPTFSPNYPLDYVAETPISGTHTFNQAYLIRCIIPTAVHTSLDYIFSIRFGNEIHADGYGLFELVFTGWGVVRLYEKIPAQGGWIHVNKWRISDYRDWTGGGAGFTLRIIPHWPQFIEFKTFSAGGIDPHIGFLNDATVESNLIRTSEQHAFGSKAHKVERPARVSLIGSGPNLRPITGEGGIKIAMRRDIRALFQVAKVAFKSSGQFTDRPFIVPSGVASQKLARIRVIGYSPTVDNVALASMSGSLEAADGTALTPASESFTLNGDSTSYTGWNPPGGPNKMRAVVTLTNHETAGSRWHTPSFEGYEIQRQAVINTVSLGEKTGGELQSAFIMGPSYRPDTESCNLVIEDPSNELPTVRTRRSPVLIETTFDAADQTKKAVLFSGFTGRVTAALKGKHGRTWPRESHHRLDCELIGHWEMLTANRFNYQQINLADGASNPAGRAGEAKLAWRVTDAIWYFLYLSGYPATALDIPTDNIRFFVDPKGTDKDALVIQPGTENLGVLAVEFARDYLNKALVFDGGAGASGTGMWRLISSPPFSTPPLCSFTLAECAASKLAHLSASYGLLEGKPIYPILDVDGAEYRSYNVRPRANVLTVKGRVKSISSGGQNHFWNQAINFTSWSAPGHESLAEPDDNPDWLGTIRPIEIIDETLPTQEAVNFMTRRIFEVACRGRRLHQFAAQLVLADVSASETFHSSRTHRPLRPGDPVNLVDMDGIATRCIVHSASFSIDKSPIQLGFYELEEFRPASTIGGWQS